MTEITLLLQALSCLSVLAVAVACLIAIPVILSAFAIIRIFNKRRR